jgi:hypothetical protein
MLVRMAVCAIAVLGIASPAMAGERAGYWATPDALRLLLQDDSATFGSRVPLTALAPGFDALPRIAEPGEPLPDTLTRFEALMSARATIAAREEAAPGFMPAARERPAGSGVGARQAIADTMADYPRPYRPHAMLDTMLTLHLDGQERTRSFNIGGIAGAVWGVLPRR